MKTRLFLTVIAAILMATNISAQEQNQIAENLGVMDYTKVEGHVSAILDKDDSTDVTKKEDAPFMVGEEILSYDEVDGHDVANLDLDGDGKVDISIIDADDSHDLSEYDMVMDYNEGALFSLGEWAEYD